MSDSRKSFAVGTLAGVNPPLSAARFVVRMARLGKLDSVLAPDHLISVFPRAIWDTDFTPQAKVVRSPDEQFDYAPLLAHLAAGAGKVQLGVGVTDPHRRHPVLLAQTFLTLAHMTKVPPILGIGSGERENLDPYGFSWNRPVERLEEALQVLRAALTATESIEFSGRHYKIDSAPMDLAAPAGRMPQIWIGAHGPRMLELTGRYADGWYPWEALSPDEYQRRLKVVHTAARAAGRDPEAIVPAQMISMLTARTPSGIRRLLRAPAVRYLGLLAPDAVWARHGAKHPFGEGFRGLIELMPHQLTKAEVQAAIAEVPDEVLHDWLVIGTPREVLARIRALADAGLRHAVVFPTAALVSNADAAFGYGVVLWLAARLRRQST
ncbi:LLM class flavin-dependent oxidoreductase [Nocardia ninae]|uniref:Phthiodiolone/phenolphthiodiolone dimycocerosates ketoreductase n=1 Tax=Nocardia ninae NBRC 108245 TaxID=1210091 RepID=A0A511MBP6_9NOCA|nr:LLM class flavin-dependent oxidoreductase [Nocardia ninae]GEM38019.1 phthiodiolone/phenolphthiodiolone dimycocerosates ketoreductase [Nocardia ninae NBRC 108245]